MSDTEYSSLDSHSNRYTGWLRSRKIIPLLAGFAVVAVIAVVALTAGSEYSSKTELRSQKDEISKMSKSVADLVAVFSQGTCTESKKRQQKDGNVDEDSGGCTDVSIPSQLGTMAQQIAALQNITKALNSQIQNMNEHTGCGGHGGCGDGGQCRNAPDVCTQLEGITECCSNTRNCACAGRDCCSRVNNTVTNINQSIETCFPIYSLPISLNSWSCYRLKNNLVLASGTGISIVGEYDIELFFDNYEILVTGIASSISIQNSHNIIIHEARIRSTTQQYDIFAAGIEIGLLTVQNVTNTGIVLISPSIENQPTGISMVDSDVLIIEPRITATPGGNETTLESVYGIYSLNSLNVVIKGGYISMPFDAPATIFEGSSFGFVAETRLLGDSFDEGTSSIDIDGLAVINASVCFDIHRVRAARVVNVRAVVDPLGLFGAAMQIGSNGVSEAITLENLNFDCDADHVAGNCLWILNTRSLVGRGITLVGRVRPELGFFRGALLNIGTPFVPVFGSRAIFRTETIDLSDMTIRATNNQTLAVHIATGLRGSGPQNISVTIRHSTIHGGLAGILLANHTSSVVLDDVTIVGSVYCFAATEGTNGVNVKDTNTFGCCRCYYADNTTTNIGLYNNFATLCSTSYLDEGVGNQFSVGPGTEGNNRVLGETGEVCEAPSLIFSPSSDAVNDPRRFFTKMDRYIKK